MQGQQLKINKIFFLTYPIISFTLGRRLGMVVYITEKSVWAGPTLWACSLWLVLVGGTHP